VHCPLISTLICLQFRVKVVLIMFMLTQAPHETNPVKIVTDACLKLYQTLISPSQGDVCNFSPSCSHFARQSIDSHGIFWGSLMASDRLLRCNPWVHQSFEKYYVGIKDHKFYDPIEDNFVLRPIQRHLRRDTAARVRY
jgi:putative membrane protein insertion efficiency factor